MEGEGGEVRVEATRNHLVVDREAECKHVTQTPGGLRQRSSWWCRRLVDPRSASCSDVATECLVGQLAAELTAALGSTPDTRCGYGHVQKELAAHALKGKEQAHFPIFLAATQMKCGHLNMRVRARS